MSAENELTLAELAKRVERLENQVELHTKCHEDNNWQIHKLTTEVRDEVNKIHALAKSLREAALSVGRETIAKVRAEVQAVVDQVKKELADKLNVNVSAEEITAALRDRILIVRNASREEIKTGQCIPTRAAGRHE